MPVRVVGETGPAIQHRVDPLIAQLQPASVVFRIRFALVGQDGNLDDCE